MKFLIANIYQPICIKVLRRYLSMKKNSVMRKGERINPINISIITYSCNEPNNLMLTHKQ